MIIIIDINMKNLANLRLFKSKILESFYWASSHTNLKENKRKNITDTKLLTYFYSFKDQNIFKFMFLH